MQRGLVVGVLFVASIAAICLVNILAASQRLIHVGTLDSALRRGTPSAAVSAAAIVDATSAARASQQSVGTPVDTECAELLEASSHVMFMILGGRGYHAARVRTILHSWARCAKHVLVFTDPSVNISGYASERRYVYLSAGDAWRKRPYLPMTHMDTVGRILARPGTPAAHVKWFFLVTDRTFVDVRALLRLLPPLDAATKGYYGAIANAAHKEAFGFHDYVDLNTGVLLSARLLERVVDPTECHDQKSAGGTFDMFDAKLGNCVYFLDATPTELEGFREADPPVKCRTGAGVGGVVSYGKIEPRQMAMLSSCASLISHEQSMRLVAVAAEQERPATTLSNIAVHVMARETRLKEIVDACETTGAAAAESLLPCRPRGRPRERLRALAWVALGALAQHRLVGRGGPRWHRA